MLRVHEQGREPGPPHLELSHPQGRLLLNFFTQGTNRLSIGPLEPLNKHALVYTWFDKASDVSHTLDCAFTTS